MLPRLNRLNVLDDVFKDSFFERNDNQLMKTDVKEKEGKYILEIDIPGYSKEDVKIEKDDDYITVIASKHQDSKEEKENYIHRERFYGECSRTFYIGENINEEDIKAKFNNGILTISFPKETEENKSKKVIEISE